MADVQLMPDPTWRKLELPAGWPPTLTVVVDTEEEFEWDKPFDCEARSISNIACQPLAQAVMDRHGIVPTYVVDYPVADSATAVHVLRSIAERGGCEIGAHLHPWVSPPYEEQVSAFNSFPGNLPQRLEREKLARLAEKIQDSFGARPEIYKAGRYGLGPSTFETLRELGFSIDVSVVPCTDFTIYGGPDFTAFPDGPFVANADIMALPLSVHYVGALAWSGASIFPHLTRGICEKLRAAGIAARLGLIERLRLSPEGHNLAEMKRQTRSALERGQRFFMLTYHSSSLLPGATSYVRTAADRAGLLTRLDEYFSFFLDDCSGQAKQVSIISNLLKCAAT